MNKFVVIEPRVFKTDLYWVPIFGARNAPVKCANTPSCHACRYRDSQRVINFLAFLPDSEESVVISANYDKIPYWRVPSFGLAPLVARGDFGQPEG